MTVEAPQVAEIPFVVRYLAYVKRRNDVVVTYWRLLELAL